MIYLELFLTFLEIGAVSFGGGYGMLSLILEKCVSNGWATEQEVMNFIAVAESTPGPIAVNMATFIGSSEAGFWGSFFATLGLVIPSFVIILIIAAVFNNLMKLKGVEAALTGVKPVVVGLILATAITMFLSSILNLKAISDGFKFEPLSLVVLALVVAVSLLYKKFLKKKISPILLIVFSAILGIIFF